MLLNFPILSNSLFIEICTHRIILAFVTPILTVLIDAAHLAKRIKFGELIEELRPIYGRGISRHCLSRWQAKTKKEHLIAINFVTTSKAPFHFTDTLLKCDVDQCFHGLNPSCARNLRQAGYLFKFTQYSWGGGSQRPPHVRQSNGLLGIELYTTFFYYLKQACWTQGVPNIVKTMMRI